MPASPIERLSAELLRELFLGTPEGMVERLRPLTESERKQLYAQLGPLIFSLNRVQESERLPFKGEIGEHPRSAYRKFDFPKILEEVLKLTPEKFRMEPHFETPFQPDDENRWKIIDFSRRRDTLRIGLAGHKVVRRRFLNLDWSEQARSLGSEWRYHENWMVLIDRPESWVKDLFQEGIQRVLARVTSFWFSQTDWVPGLQEVIRKFPDIATDAYRLIGNILGARGLFGRSWEQNLDAASILAGLSADTDDPPRWLNTENIQRLRALTDNRTLPRDTVLEIVLRQLEHARNQQRAGAWAKLHEALKPTKAEILRHSDFYAKALFSKFATVVRIGIRGTEVLLKEGTVSVTETLPTLAMLLNHESQPAATDAWKLFEKLTNNDAGCGTEYISDVIDALSSPHGKLRPLIATWLARHAAKLTDAHRAVITALTPSLGVAEREALAVFLTESEEKTPHDGKRQEMQSLIAPLLEFSRTLPVDRRRADYLNRFLAGQPGTLDPMPPDFEQALDITITPFSSAEELALELVESRFRNLTELELERMIDAIAKFRSGGRNPTVVKTLDPLLQREKVWNASNGKLESDLLRGFNGFQEFVLLSLAHAWVTSGDEFKLTNESANHRFGKFESLEMEDAIRLMCKRLASASDAPFLATPTHRDGWIHPAVLAERLRQSPPEYIDLTDLTRALYRLPISEAARNSAWGIIQVTLSDLPEIVRWALTLTFGDDHAASEAARHFLALFEKEPPNDSLFHWPINHHQSDTDIARSYHRLERNIRFQLFHGALRGRLGLGDGREWAQNVPLGELCFETLVWEKYSAETTTVRNRASDSNSFNWLVNRWLFYPEPITTTLFGKHVLEFQSDDFQFRWTDTFYPHLAVYGIGEWLFDRHQTPTGASVANRNLMERFPNGAQRLFESACASLFHFNEIEVGKFLSIGYESCAGGMLAEAGSAPHIEIAPGLKPYAGILRSEVDRFRETAVSLFTRWLDDGRATPFLLAEAIAAELRRDRIAGFKFLLDALHSFGNACPAGNLVSLFSIELALSDGVEGIPLRNLSALLEQLERLLEETGRNVTESKAKAALDLVAGWEKKSVAVETARRIARRTAAPDQLPAEIAAVYELLAASHAKTLPTA